MNTRDARFWLIVIIIGGLVSWVAPGFIQIVLFRLLNEVSPAVGPLLTIAILIAAARMMIGGRRKK